MIEADFANRYPSAEKDKAYFKALRQALASEFLWGTSPTLTIESEDSTPDSTILFGRTVPKSAHIPDPDQVEIAVGNTGTDALSAYLGAKLSSPSGVAWDQRQREDVLEAIQFSASLRRQMLDVGPKFQEARHDKGFTAFPGGTLWRLRFESIETGSAADRSLEAGHELNLPDHLVDRLPENMVKILNQARVLLAEVNDLQVAHDRAVREAESQRCQLFADWYRYMLNAYPADNDPSANFDSDAVMDFIRNVRFPAVRAALDASAEVAMARDAHGRFLGAQKLGGGRHEQPTGGEARGLSRCNPQV